MTKLIPTALVVLFLMLLSCENPAGEGARDGGGSDPGAEGSGSRWYMMDRVDKGGYDLLRFSILEKTSSGEFEGTVEFLSNERSSGSYDFLERFYIRLLLEGAQPPFSGRIGGIKTQASAPYLTEGEDGFTALTERLGMARFTAVYSGDERVLTLTLPAQESLSFSMQESFSLSRQEILNVDGKLRNGTWEERGDYFPRQGEYHFSLRQYFTYTDESGARVTLSWGYLIYGSRVPDPVAGGYACSVDKFTLGGYPLIFFGSGSVMYDKKISSLGFDSFGESYSGGIRVLEARLSDGSNLSWSLTPYP